jgi:hypothetical protein
VATCPDTYHVRGSRCGHAALLLPPGPEREHNILLHPQTMTACPYSAHPTPLHPPYRGRSKLSTSHGPLVVRTHPCKPNGYLQYMSPAKVDHGSRQVVHSTRSYTTPQQLGCQPALSQTISCSTSDTAQGTMATSQLTPGKPTSSEPSRPSVSLGPCPTPDSCS